MLAEQARLDRESFRFHSQQLTLSAFFADRLNQVLHLKLIEQRPCRKT